MIINTQFKDITIVCYKNGDERMIKGNCVKEITDSYNSGNKLFHCKNHNGVDMSIILCDIQFIYYTENIEEIRVYE